MIKLLRNLWMLTKVDLWAWIGAVENGLKWGDDDDAPES